jgi:hypothetical protein
MAETAPTRKKQVRPQLQPREEPQLSPSPRFRPLMGSLTMIVLAIGGSIVMSPVAAKAPGQGPDLPPPGG